MKDLLKLLKQFIPPYKKYVILNILFNLLSALLGVFSFGALVPILNILFKVDGVDKVFEYMEMDFSSIDSCKVTIMNNLNYAIQHAATVDGITYVLVFLAIFLVIGTLVKTGTSYLAAFFHIPIRTGVVRDIRQQIDDKILSLPLGFFSNERKGDIIARMTGDVSEVEGSVMSSLDMISKNPILILVYLGTMLFISWQLTLFVFILLPVAGFIMGRIGKSLKKKSLEAQNKWGVLMSQIEETLSGLRIIKAFGAENKIANRFNTTSNEFRDMSNRIARRQQLAHPVSEFLGTITIAIVLCFGGTLILGDNASIEASTFVYYLTIFYMIIQPAKDLSKSIYTIKKGMASMERIDKILGAPNEIQEPENPQPVVFEHEVSYRNVWFKYQNDWVIKDVSITVPKGQTIALVGQSGSGKSTMVDLLPRFYDVQKGGIYLDKKNISEFRTHDLRMVMGNVNQDAILFNDSFFNNIAFGVENATIDDVIEAAKVANAHDFISATPEGYNTNIGDRGGKLSGGQRQRISIARAILKNPQILILDEATSALDTESEKLVQDALDNLMKNRTTIVVAHRLSTIKNADKIYVMHEGVVVEEGCHDELYNMNGYYRKLCDMQQF